MAPDNDQKPEAAKITEPSGHVWIRTVPTDGRWCEACGLAEARWSGDICPGEGAARRIERLLIAERKAHAEELRKAVMRSAGHVGGHGG